LTITLSGVAPAGGVSVSASSGGSLAFPVQPFYLIPEGQSSVSFGVQAGPVSASTGVAVSAGYGGASQVTMVTVTPAPSSLTLSSVGVSPATITSGQTATLTLTLSGPAPSGGVTVSVSTGNPSAFPALLQYVIPEGQSSASFAVVTGAVTAAVTVPVGGAFAGTSQVAMASILPPAPSPVLSALDISPAIAFSGATTTLTLTLNTPAPTGGAGVSVSTGNLTAFPALPLYVIPAGQTSATFGIQTGTVPFVTVVPVTAGYGGASLTTQMVLIPPM
jgi:hypothetical protein